MAQQVLGVDAATALDREWVWLGCAASSTLVTPSSTLAHSIAVLASVSQRFRECLHALLTIRWRSTPAHISVQRLYRRRVANATRASSHMRNEARARSRGCSLVSTFRTNKIGRRTQPLHEKHLDYSLRVNTI